MPRCNFRISNVNHIIVDVEVQLHKKLDKFKFQNLLHTQKKAYNKKRKTHFGARLKTAIQTGRTFVPHHILHFVFETQQLFY